MGHAEHEAGAGGATISPMPSAVGPEIARAAVALRRSHPHAPASEVLGLVMRQRAGRLTDLGDTGPCTPFGQLLAEAFDRGMTPRDWRVVMHPNTAPAVVAALMGIPSGEVPPR